MEEETGPGVTPGQTRDAMSHFSVRNGVTYMMRTSDTVGAVSWGVSPFSLMPCCLGERAVGIGVLPSGFQYGRHVVLEERALPAGWHAEPHRVSRLPLSTAGTSSSPSESQTPLLGPLTTQRQPLYSSPRAAASDRWFSFRFHVAGTRQDGCLEMDGMRLSSTRHYNAAVFDERQLFRLVPARDSKVLPSHRMVQYFDHTTLGQETTEEHEDLNLDSAFHIEPLTLPGCRLRWGLREVTAWVTSSNDPRQIFLLHPRSPHVITDFAIAPCSLASRVLGAFNSADRDDRRCELQLWQSPVRRVTNSSSSSDGDVHSVPVESEAKLAAMATQVPVDVKQDFLTSQVQVYV